MIDPNRHDGSKVGKPVQSMPAVELLPTAGLPKGDLLQPSSQLRHADEHPQEGCGLLPEVHQSSK